MRGWRNRPASGRFVALIVVVWVCAFYAFGYGLIALLRWCCT